MFVEFERALETQFGEDDGINPTASAPIAINPTYVAALFASQEENNVVIVKCADGRGLKVRGNYTDVRTKLLATPALN
jgi:hypothetical protein